MKIIRKIIRKPPAPLGGRPALARMTTIFTLIRAGTAGKRPTRQSIATELEVAVKTVQRDIDFMRDRLELPISVEPRRGGYFFDREVESFPLLSITEGECLAVLLTQQLGSNLRGTPFEVSVMSLMTKLQQGLRTELSLRWTDISDAVSQRSSAVSIDPAVFRTVADAVRQFVPLEMDYRGTKDRAPRRRRLEPYHLVLHQGMWYCVGLEGGSGKVKTFALSRMSNVQALSERFERPRRFSIEKHLSGSFGIFSMGNSTHDIALRFAPRAAVRIRERTWMAGQTMQELSDGSVELRFRVSALEELVPWVLSWGGDCRVLAGKALQTRVNAEIQRMAKR